MSSIFDLKTNVKQLVSANQGTSRMEYQQQPPTRDVTTTNFPNGAIHFRWQTSGQKWWIPNRSYLRVRCSLTKANGDGLVFADNIAPNMGLCASLFQSAEFRINDKTVSRISDFLPQVDALETRLTKSRSWLNGVGNAVNFWQPVIEERQNIVILDNGDGVISKSTVAAENLGFAPADTIAIAAATGVLTFAGAALPDAGDVFKAGDIIEIDIGGAIGTVRYNVSTVPSATTLQLNNQVYVVLAATAAPFRRIRQVNDNSRSLSSFELIWTPPLSLFKIGHALPSGKYELVLNPQTASVYQKAAIESILGDGDKTPAADYKFTVETMYLYVNTVEGDRCDDITYLLDLEQTRCQADKVDGPSFAQKSWDVSPSTYALTVAYQDTRAGTNTQASASKFKSYEDEINFDEPK